jgi:hypothetical protein
MILDILTVLFFVSGFVFILMMIAERRRDVLHGPYVTKSDRMTDLDLRSIGSNDFAEHGAAAANPPPAESPPIQERKLTPRG